jgi:mono/diheme cytochrome c family protein
MMQSCPPRCFRSVLSCSGCHGSDAGQAQGTSPRGQAAIRCEQPRNAKAAHENAKRAGVGRASPKPEEQSQDFLRPKELAGLDKDLFLSSTSLQQQCRQQ